MTLNRMIPLKCAGCGAMLDISPDMDVFACGYCGLNQQVERRGGTVALKQVGEAIRRVQAGTDRTAAELAIRRLTAELEDAKAQRQEILYPSTGLTKLHKVFGIPLFGAVAWTCFSSAIEHFTGFVFGFGIVSSLITLAMIKTFRMSRKNRLLLEQLNGQIELLEQQSAANRLILGQPLS